jgi:formylmethanofuran dehydrogenase subunit E
VKVRVPFYKGNPTPEEIAESGDSILCTQCGTLHPSIAAMMLDTFIFCWACIRSGAVWQPLHSDIP